MTIGAALLLIAVGAILRFAVQTVSTHGINLHTIGDILMLIGVVGLLLWVFVWGPWSWRRRRRLPPQDTPLDDPYPGQRVDYQVEERRVEEYPGDYPTEPVARRVRRDVRRYR
jgi:hypothetical protein